MKRTELRRKSGLKRASSLTTRKPLERTGALKRSSKKKRDPQAAHAFYLAVATYENRHGKLVVRTCAVCKKRRSRDAHHVIAKSVIEQDIRIALALRSVPREEVDEIVKLWIDDPRIGLPVCRECHDAHESASRRILRHRLPAQVWAFADQLDAFLGVPRATNRLKHDYPERAA